MESLSVVSLGEEFFTDSFDPSELGKRWVGVIRPLQENPIKDADRAGEKLRVFSTVEHDGDDTTWNFLLHIIGDDSGIEHATLRCLFSGEDMNTDALVELELHLVAGLTAALNGPDRFTPAERDALAEALGDGGIACDHCDKRFAFFSEALAHEQSCQGPEKG